MRGVNSGGGRRFTIINYVVIVCVSDRIDARIGFLKRILFLCEMQAARIVNQPLD